MDLDEGDRVVAMSIIEEGAKVLAITELGYGKRTEIDEYRIQSRAGKGILAMRLTDKTGFLAGQMLVTQDEDILVITDDGTIIRTPIDAIPTLGRATQGVRVMRVADGSRIVSFERAEAEDDEDECTEETAEAEKDGEI
jgi:DNA gyrase subunit A